MTQQKWEARVALAVGLAFAAMGAVADDAQVKRGKHLVDTLDCHGCHTPMKMGPKGPEMDMARALSGHPESMVMPPPPKLDGPWNWVGAATVTAFAGPWGVSYAINLTPDKDTGIASWKEADFVKALKTGKHLGTGRPILPPMPWHAYSNLSETDLKAIFAYLHSIPAVKNKVPEAQVAPPPPAAQPAPAAAPKK
jgi:hypothetical protein